MSAVVLGVSGGVAAYKAAELLRLFTESSHRVRVVPTEAALQFVGTATWEALSANPVETGVFADVWQVPHVRIGQSADLVVVAPATADLLAKAATGQADDLLTNTLLTARCPVLMVPAMHTEMWEHSATQDNVSTLRRRGVVVLEPDSGRLTGVDSGKGRLPEPEQIFSVAARVLEDADRETADLRGVRALVSAGGTREYLDPVRFLGNRSSGRQGLALAESAVARGAEVTLVAANVALPVPAGVDLVRVQTTAQLREEMVARAPDADVVVMSAAPADFRPAATEDAKIKKSADGTVPSLDLVQNPDILVELVGARAVDSPLIVGFAAETGDAQGSAVEHARAKLARKGCDLLVLNDVSSGRAFDRPDNEVTVLGDDGTAVEVPRTTKIAVAQAIWDVVVPRLRRSAEPGSV